jgi:hypothetical protein
MTGPALNAREVLAKIADELEAKVLEAGVRAAALAATQPATAQPVAAPAAPAPALGVQRRLPPTDPDPPFESAVDMTPARPPAPPVPDSALAPNEAVPAHAGDAPAAEPSNVVPVDFLALAHAVNRAFDPPPPPAVSEVIAPEPPAARIEARDVAVPPPPPPLPAITPVDALEAVVLSAPPALPEEPAPEAADVAVPSLPDVPPPAFSEPLLIEVVEPAPAPPAAETGAVVTPVENLVEIPADPIEPDRIDAVVLSPPPAANDPPAAFAAEPDATVSPEPPAVAASAAQAPATRDSETPVPETPVPANDGAPVARPMNLAAGVAFPALGWTAGAWAATATAAATHLPKVLTLVPLLIALLALWLSMEQARQFQAMLQDTDRNALRAEYGRTCRDVMQQYYDVKQKVSVLMPAADRSNIAGASRVTEASRLDVQVAVGRLASYAIGATDDGLRSRIANLVRVVGAVAERARAVQLNDIDRLFEPADKALAQVNEDCARLTRPARS